MSSALACQANVDGTKRLQEWRSDLNNEIAPDMNSH
jgi:hypothetical protein